ncbi:hypothetical protein ACT453_54805, partial [Bacillus sp. D-CC]
VMNFSYMFSGSIGVNPQMVILSMFVLVSGMNAGKFGMDGFVIPKVLGSKIGSLIPGHLLHWFTAGMLFLSAIFMFIKLIKFQ